MQSVREPRREGERGPALWPTIVRLVIFNAVLFALVYFLGRGVFEGFGLAAPAEQPVEAMAPSTPSVFVAEGTVVNNQARGVGSVFPGTVRSLEIRRGQRVTKGQLLFRMDPAEVQKRIRAARQGTARTGAAVTRAYEGRERALKPLKSRVSRLEARVKRQRAAWNAGQERVRAARKQAAQAVTRGHSVARATADMNAALDRLKALKKEHAATAAELGAAERKWHKTVVEAIRNHRDAKTGLKPLQALLKQQNRYSPVDGIVTSVRAAEGEWIAAKEPVVRVDDPSGFRIVALVDQAAREPLKEGLTVPVELDGKRTRAEVAEIQPGWGRELFRYWVYLEPEEPQALMPRQAVRIALPTQVAQAAPEAAEADEAETEDAADEAKG